MKQPVNLVVLGSVNLDLVIRTPRLPLAGETVLAHSSREVCGGKGANQAVAAARLGATVSMIAAVGNDAYGSLLRDNLLASGVDASAVAVPPMSSGLAIVAVDDQGQNQILVSPGANFAVTPSVVDQHVARLAAAETLLCQLELPIETVVAAVGQAKRLGMRVILNPAPMPRVFPEELFEVDLLCPNQTEAALLLGRSIENAEQAQQAASDLVARGAKHAIITLGGDGAVVCDGERNEWLQPHAVEAVDTTAAGDAFAGALAAAWHGDVCLFTAAKRASAAAALSVTRSGAQPSLPTSEELDRWLQQHTVSTPQG